MFEKSYVYLHGGGVGGQKLPKSCVRNQWMAPNVKMYKFYVIYSYKTTCDYTGNISNSETKITKKRYIKLPYNT